MSDRLELPCSPSALVVVCAAYAHEGEPHARLAAAILQAVARQVVPPCPDASPDYLAVRRKLVRLANELAGLPTVNLGQIRPSLNALRVGLAPENQNGSFGACVLEQNSDP